MNLDTGEHHRRAERAGDPALERILRLLAVDERAHHASYREVVKVFLDLDRQATVEQLRRVLHTFAMPALSLLADSQCRQAKVRELKVFDEEVFFAEVYQPLLRELGVSRGELRGRQPKKSARAAGGA